MTVSRRDVRLLPLLLLLLCAAVCMGKELPSYVKACRRTDPELNACALRNARLALPTILKGDPSIRLPVFEPLTVTEMAVQESGLSIVMRDVNISGIGLGNVVDARIYLDDGLRFEFDYNTPKADMAFQYNVSGKVLVLPITGKGPGVFHFSNLSTHYKIYFDTYKKNGEEYLKGKVSNVTSDIGHLSLHLDNLFNGDKFLGDNMNNVLNDNWKVLVQDFGPAITATLTEVAQVVVDRITNDVPFAKILLP